VAVTATEEFVERWEAAVASADVAAVESLFAADVTFRSPALFRPTVGRAPTTLVLAAVLEVFGELRYTHRYLDEPDGVTLQFETSVGADDGRRLDVEGVDIFRLDPEGRIASLTVMLRPLNATQAVAARMREQLGLG
jgi:ketosteroid isomerase-like protein